MENFSGNELKEYLKNSKYNSSQIAQRVGISRQALYSYLNAKELKVTTLEKILNAAELPSISDSFDLQEPTVPYGNRSTKNRIPLIPNFSAIAGNGSGEFSVKSSDVEEYYNIPGMEDADFMIRVKGDSMDGVYDNGSVIICKMINDRNLLQEGRAYLVYASDLGAVVKYVRKANEEEIMLESENTQYLPIRVPGRSIKNIARILGSIRYEG